ncbi:MAG: cytochrome C biogenesis protein, partial [Ginsengibacter sp.]
FLAMGRPDAVVYNGLFWMIQLFVCINAVAKSFLQESKGRMIYFQSVTGPIQFIISKLIYSTVIMLMMTLISILLFIFLLGNPVSDHLQFIGIAFLGAFSLSLVFTLMAAIAAKAQQNAAIMAILGFPLIVPQLLLLIRLSKSAFGEIFKEGALLQISLVLGALDLLVIVLAIVLFPFLWND